MPSMARSPESSCSLRPVQGARGILGLLAALPESAEMVRRPGPGRRRRGAKWGPAWQREEEEKGT